MLSLFCCLFGMSFCLYSENDCRVDSLFSVLIIILLFKFEFVDLN